MTIAADAPLTDRQAAVLSIVAAYHDLVREPCPASLVARRLGIHHEAVRGHYAVLYRKGWLVAETSPAKPKRPFLARRLDG